MQLISKEERINRVKNSMVSYKAIVFQKVVGKLVSYVTSEGMECGYIYDYVNAFGDDLYIVTDEREPKELTFPDTFAYVHPSFIVKMQ